MLIQNVLLSDLINCSVITCCTCEILLTSANDSDTLQQPQYSQEGQEDPNFV